LIKGITVVRTVKSAPEWEQLKHVFDALGFEHGKGWEDGHSKGAPFTSPYGAIEFVHGAAPAEGDLLIEVTGLDAVHERAKKAAKGKEIKISDLKPTHWNSRYFKAEAPGVHVAFWEFDEPQKLRFQTHEGDLIAPHNARFGIVVSRFNALITERLLHGALDALHRTGVKDSHIEVIRVPGAFEVPIAARKLAEAKHVDAVICLGLLMRGETSNYEHISAEVARGIGQSAQETGVPHAYGVLTCETLEQAIDRAGLKMGNKGFEAAISAVEMVSLGEKLEHNPHGGHGHEQRHAASARERRGSLRFSDLERAVDKVSPRKK
jgi:6,7-dimethyl-8-ribityllumazine synthase